MRKTANNDIPVLAPEELARRMKTIRPLCYGPSSGLYYAKEKLDPHQPVPEELTCGRSFPRKGYDCLNRTEYLPLQHRWERVTPAEILAQIPEVMLKRGVTAYFYDDTFRAGVMFWGPKRLLLADCAGLAAQAERIRLIQNVAGWGRMYGWFPPEQVFDYPVWSEMATQTIDDELVEVGTALILLEAYTMAEVLAGSPAELLKQAHALEIVTDSSDNAAIADTPDMAQAVAEGYTVAKVAYFRKEVVA